MTVHTSVSKPNALDPNRQVGAVCAVFPNRVHVNLGDASARARTSLYGHPLGTGQVGEFLLIGSDDLLVIGRVNAIRLVERERLSINPSLGDQPLVDPIGEVELMATFDRATGEVVPGVATHPRLGTFAYAPPPSLLSDVVSLISARKTSHEVVFSLGEAVGVPDSKVRATPEQLFGRHCAILGATGGGKSYTVAKLLEEAANVRAKTILIDATGEFYTLGNSARHLSVGTPLHGESEVHIPFSALEEQDLVGLFQPSGKTQVPKLREAMYSLRLVHILDHTSDPRLLHLKSEMATQGVLKDGLLRKPSAKRKAFEDAMSMVRRDVEAPDAPFDIAALPDQIVQECVGPYGKLDQFDKFDEQGAVWCNTLISRIRMICNGPELRSFFRPVGTDLFDEIDKFLSGPEAILRVSLASVPFLFSAREVIANAVGRRLLRLARCGVFKASPTVVFLDEAHNFLNRKIGDDETVVRLDAFEQIAKEGRKYWLTICLATQRPRDLPDGVLSQMGTMIVHRLINHIDRETVERACGEIDRASVAFLPTLTPGQAAVIGVGFPFPLTVQMEKPIRYPDSRGPDFQSHWSKPAVAL